MAIKKGRFAPIIEGDFVVFIIGMRVNKPWKLHKWLPVAMAMPRMLKELGAHPELGLLGVRTLPGLPPVGIQYWRSWEALERFARSKDNKHFPAWVKFNRAVGTNGDVGIWHETYRVRAGEYEAIYNSVPPMGLGKVGELVPASGRKSSAAGRLGLSEGDDAPVDEAGRLPAATP